MKEESVTDKAILLLNNIYSVDIPSGPDQRPLLKATIDLLFKIISNIIAQPMEPKYRKLPKKS